jgi:hypothetical protein
MSGRPYHQSDSHGDCAARNLCRAVGDWIRLIEHRAHAVAEAAQAHRCRELGALAREGARGPDSNEANFTRLQTFGRKRAANCTRRLKLIGVTR